MKRVFELFVIAVVAGAVYFSNQASWSTPGETLRNVPKNVRSNPGSYRTHYRTVYIYRGGK
jgi:hypothetical protein